MAIYILWLLLFEYGFEDNDLNCFMNKRAEWIGNGLRVGFKLCPEKYFWSLDVALAQLANLKLLDLKNYPDGEKMNPNYTSIVNMQVVKWEWYKHRIA